MGNPIPPHTPLVLPNGEGNPPLILNADNRRHRAVAFIWQAVTAAAGLGLVALSVALA